MSNEVGLSLVKHHFLMCVFNLGKQRVLTQTTIFPST